MAKILFILCLIKFNFVFAIDKDIASSAQNEPKNIDNREGKLFSLFSIVQFRNEACTSSQTLSNTGTTTSRNGTCFSSTECRDKNGQASGGCAAGFGVCCVFVYETSGSTISQNCSYIRNPNYPDAYTDTNSLAFNIVKCSSDVCYLRLDFESFDINGLSESLEYDNTNMNLVACQDKMQITSPADPGLPEICGLNTGQHVYVDMGTQASESVALSFDFTGTYSRFFEVKVTQLPCTSEYNRFPGCLQYHEGLTGRIETFNYGNCVKTQSHLPNQDYSICVRPEAGYDCVQWQLCPDQPCGADGAVGNGIMLPPNADKTMQDDPCTAFSVGVDADPEKAVKANLCKGDLIRIPGGSTPCCQGSNPRPLQDAICGYYFNVEAEGEVKRNTPICDCVAPYSVDIQFDNVGDPLTTMQNTLSSCGVCLIYNQVRC